MLSCRKYSCLLCLRGASSSLWVYCEVLIVLASERVLCPWCGSAHNLFCSYCIGHAWLHHTLSFMPAQFNQSRLGSFGFVFPINLLGFSNFTRFWTKKWGNLTWFQVICSLCAYFLIYDGCSSILTWSNIRILWFLFFSKQETCTIVTPFFVG